MSKTIAECVEPLRSDAKDRAEKFAREYANRLLDELRSVAWDAEVSAPYPNSCKMNRNEYIAAKVKHNIVRRLTKATSTQCRSPKDPDIRIPNPERIEKFVEEAREDADRQYTAFIAKLESKIGPHSDANLIGNHIWNYSILTVETPNGTQNWKTQQIINVSKLGKVFNQWPTRQVK